MQHEATVDQSWAWLGTVDEFQEIEDSKLLTSLEVHHFGMFAMDAAGSQRSAWQASIAMLRQALALVCQLRTDAPDWGLVFEYELPFEGGRRPDVLLLAGDSVLVLEFKEAGRLTMAHADQVQAYARDLCDYHSESHELEVLPVLVSTAGVQQRRAFARVEVAGTPEQLADVLTAQAARGPAPQLAAWVAGTYAPLPTIVEAARRIFRDESLPRIKAVDLVNVHETVDLVEDLVADAREGNRRLLVLLAGVPGSGKTLAGLRIVYEHHNDGAPATFLSGNGPLVKVLQDALKSTVFVRDLHKAIHAYGTRAATPQHHVIVFDEAQRAWDREKMLATRQLDASEPDILVSAGCRIPDWAVLVGLVGDGQEIHGGEEAGLGQWRHAMEQSGEDWVVHCPPRLAPCFSALDVRTHNSLDLTRSLRSRRAERLHAWVSRLLGEELDIAAELAAEINQQMYPMRLFRDLDAARAYVRQRYADEPGKLYGLLASSHAKNLASHGVDNSWLATSRVRVERWFNDLSSSDSSGCQLVQPITEFMCQGLELDLPVVCWGSDLVWRGDQNDQWQIRPVRRKFPLRDPEQIVLNTYRVLLTRGRDGIAIFVPPSPNFDKTAAALVRAGVHPVSDDAARDGEGMS